MAHLMIGSSPWGVDGAQLGQADYEEFARAECQAFIGQLERHYQAANGEALPCKLIIKENPHDFGTYLTVDALFTEGEASEKAAYWLEANTPKDWDAEALLSLPAPAWPFA